MHEGTAFAQAVSGDGNEGNTVYVQDAIIASQRHCALHRDAG